MLKGNVIFQVRICFHVAIVSDIMIIYLCPLEVYSNGKVWLLSSGFNLIDTLC